MIEWHGDNKSNIKKKKRKRSSKKDDASPKKKQKIEKAPKEVVAKSLDEEELLDAIIENAVNFHFILSLSGKLIYEGATKKEMKSAYRKLSKLVHPDRHNGSQKSTKAFQIVVNAFENLHNPKPEDIAPTSRKKDERVARSNKNCKITEIFCPRCGSVWNRQLLGIENAAYNFFMMAIKRYICGSCACKFGCLTAIHKTPCCNKSFIYDPDMYDTTVVCQDLKSPPDVIKVTKKQKTCKKSWGFSRYKVSETRQKAIRKEVKKEQEAERKVREAKKRRNARFNRRSPQEDVTSKMQETLFIIGLHHECPRCGDEIESRSPSQHTQNAKDHLANCKDATKINAYQAKLAEKKAEEEKRKQEEQEQAEVLILKTWEINGRQVGQLWMLPENQLRKQCVMHKLKSKGSKPDLIKRMVKYLKSQQKLMITDGREYKENKNGANRYEIVGLKHVDEDDLPDNLHTLELDELQGLCAGYEVPYTKKNTKKELIKKFEKKRYKGTGILAIEG